MLTIIIIYQLIYICGVTQAIFFSTNSISFSLTCSSIVFAIEIVTKITEISQYLLRHVTTRISQPLESQANLNPMPAVDRVAGKKGYLSCSFIFTFSSSLWSSRIQKLRFLSYPSKLKVSFRLIKIIIRFYEES